MQIRQSTIQKCKIAAHVLQVIFIFVAWCISIAVYTKDGGTGAASSFYFALCFLTIPALLYLVMVPMWTRTVRFANAYAYALIDILYTIFWFSAFVSLAVWLSHGIRQGAIDKKLDHAAGNCTTFAYGSESKCKLSYAVVDIGVVIFLLFLATSAISIYIAIQYRRTGVLLTTSPHPYASASSPGDIEASTKDAWSTDTAEIDNPLHAADAEYDSASHSRSSSRTAKVRDDEDEYTLLHATDTEEGRHPGRPLSWGSERREREVGLGLGVGERTGYGEGDWATPSALSPDEYGYEEYRGAAYGFESVGRR